MKGSPKQFDLRPADSVRVVQNADGAVLLDVHQGICFDTNTVGLMIWRLLGEGSSNDQIIQTIAAHFQGIPQEQIAKDVTDFVSSLKQKDLLTTTPPTLSDSLFEKLLVRWQQRQQSKNKAERTAIRFLSLKAFLGLLTYDLFRFSHNFPRLYRWIKIWKTIPNVPSSDTVELVTQAINYACLWYPKRIMCLQRSAVTTCLLRACGVSARMALGAQKSPFKAHAWTEVDGTPINERRDVQRAFIVWDRC
jgi:Transglutaminase-like superfamily/Coenzyme PQQ synthesis protein D (PqqD)